MTERNLVEAERRSIGSKVTLAAWDAYRKAHAPTMIYRSDETGEYVWAVVVKGTGFWLGAFKTRSEARAFVRGWKEEHYIRSSPRLRRRAEEG